MLSKKAKYALNALVYLTKNEENGPILISQIAQSENIPQKFLEAILLTLKNAGILASKKGKGGGYYLLKNPNEVYVSEIMRLIDGPIALLPCVSLQYYQQCDECTNEEICGIRDVFMEVRNNTLSILNNTSLQNIIERENKKTI